MVKTEVAEGPVKEVTRKEIVKAMQKIEVRKGNCTIGSKFANDS